MKLVWKHPLALEWAARRIDAMHGQPFADNAMACAFVDDAGIVGVVAFHDWQPAYRTIQVSAAADSPRWMLARACWAEAWAYAFSVADKVWTLTPHTNTRALRFVKALGFTPSAVLDHQFGRNVHAVFSHKFKWDHYEQAEAANAA